MGAVETDIILTATGGDAATAEVAKASSAIEGLTESGGRLKEKFQEKFQHIGLKVFAGDALRAAGVGKETRAVIGLLNMALKEGAAAAGLSSGGILLVVAALAALVGIGLKVLEHQKSMLENTEKRLDADTKELKTLREKIDELEKYEQVAGRLNRVQTDYLSTLKEIAAEEASKKNNDLIDRIQALNMAIEKEKEHLNQVDAVQSLIKGTTVTYAQSTKAVAEHNVKLNDMKLKLREAEVEMNALHRTGTGTFKDLSKAATDAAKTSDEMWKKYWEDVAKEQEKVHEKIISDLKKQVEFTKHAADQIGSSLGSAFAKSIVEGKDFTEQMQDAFKNMAEKMIEDIIRMEVEWMIFSAMSGMGGIAGGIGVSGLQGLPFGHAIGGDLMVDKPTLFLAGEAGPERATFTPMNGGSKSSAPSSGGGVKIGSMPVHVTVHGVNNPDKIADEVGLKIIRKIRGAGQLSFVR